MSREIQFQSQAPNRLHDSPSRDKQDADYQTQKTVKCPFFFLLCPDQSEHKRTFTTGTTRDFKHGPLLDNFEGPLLEMKIAGETTVGGMTVEVTATVVG